MSLWAKRQCHLAKLPVVPRDQLTVLQRMLDDTGRIKRVKPLAHVLQDENLSPVVDFRNRVAKAERQRPEALVTTLSQGGAFCFG